MKGPIRFHETGTVYLWHPATRRVETTHGTFLGSATTMQRARLIVQRWKAIKAERALSPSQLDLCQ